MKFTFKLEKLLNHKKVLEDIARRDFFEAQNKLDKEISKLEAHRNDLKEAYVSKFITHRKGGSVSSDLKSIEEYMEGKKILIQRQENIILGLRQIVEEKRKRLIEAAQQHKIYDKLKEKKRHDFTDAQRKKEIKTMDELVVTYAKRSKGYE